MVALNRCLELQEPERVADGAGGFSESWVKLGEVWASIDARTALGGGTAGADLSRVRYRILLRAAPQGSTARPKPGQRLAEGGRLFLIDAVSEFDRLGLYLECWAHEEVLA
ncbi:MAG: head-tail adaptor protein [Rhodobacteraceae bacterium]|nr:head-tail adaptor protein [Paracoccaceae bacterium]